MESIDLSPRDEDLTVEVTLERLYKQLGEQGILGADEGVAFFYLAALALECKDDDDYSATDVVMEFIHNSAETEHVTIEAADRIEDLLR